MRLAHERRNHADDQRQKKPRRKQKDARRQAGRCDALLKQTARRLNHDQPVGALHPGAIHLVVENGIFVGSQVEREACSTMRVLMWRVNLSASTVSKKSSTRTRIVDRLASANSTATSHQK